MDAKAIQVDLENVNVALSLAKLEMKREVGRQKPAHKMTESNESK